MSWTILTVIFVVACFLCAFVLCEWIVKRTHGSSGNDGDPTAGQAVRPSTALVELANDCRGLQSIVAL